MRRLPNIMPTAVQIHGAKQDIQDISEILATIGPEWGGDKIKQYFQEWSSAIRRTDLDMAKGLHFLQIIHAIKGYDCKQMDTWIKTQASLIEAQSRHMERWVNTQQTKEIEKKFQALRSDFEALIDLLKSHVTEDEFKAIMEEWRALRTTEPQEAFV